MTIGNKLKGIKNMQEIVDLSHLEAKEKKPMVEETNTVKERASQEKNKPETPTPPPRKERKPLPLPEPVPKKDISPDPKPERINQWDYDPRGLSGAPSHGRSCRPCFPVRSPACSRRAAHQHACHIVPS